MNTKLEKFQHPEITATGEVRASVPFRALEILWFNTGTLCNLNCANCYIESSPKNDRLQYISTEEVRTYLDEVEKMAEPLKTIGFTGGEPFMNRSMIEILEHCLERGYEALVLSNAYKMIRKRGEQLLDLKARFGKRLQLRVSLDHYQKELHEEQRGSNTFDETMKNLKWLGEEGFAISIAGRSLAEESISESEEGYKNLMRQYDIPLELNSPTNLTVFPEMDGSLQVPEISVNCWAKVKVSPDALMCSNSRMVLHRKGEEKPSVVSCTLLPYDEQFELGETIEESKKDVFLNHPHCAKFCVLGGASCSESH